MTHLIVPATEELVADIEIWLDAEEASFQAGKDVRIEASFGRPTPSRGFRCNWDTVKKSWHEGRVPLHVLVQEGAAIGFLSGTDILEIKPDQRGRGLGALLSDFMLCRAFEQGYSILEIQIAPQTAAPFWLRQGFKLLDSEIHLHNSLYAYKTIARSFSLGSGPREQVTIEFYGERAVQHGERPFLLFEGEGERLPNGDIQLPERVIGYSPLLRINTDNHVRIVVDGEVLYFNRSKYGNGYGTARDPGGNHYIDRICPIDRLG